jgi:membrane fusion protein (multidrug efflux system)
MSLREGEARAATPRAPGQDRPRSGSRFRLWLVLALAGTALVIGGVLWWLEARRWETTDDAFIDVHVVHVAPQVAGRVVRVLVGDNERVQAGQELLDIDPATFQAKLDQTAATQQSAAGSLAQAKAQQAAAVANEAEADAQVGVAKADAVNAANQLGRDQPLAARGVVSHQQLDNDIAAARRTAATLVAAQKKLAATAAQVAVAQSQVATAESNLASAAAQTRQAQLDLSYTRLFASDAGYIANKSVAPGDYVQVGQNLMALVPVEVWVTANFKETQLARMRVGDSVEISVDAYPGKTFRGHVESFQAGSGPAFSLLPPENATGNYVKVVQRVPVKIVFDSPPDLNFPLGPGMSVEPSVKVR